MLFSTKLLALPIFIWYTSVLASPLDNVYAEEGKRALKRQDGGDDIETLAQLDPIRTGKGFTFVGIAHAEQLSSCRLCRQLRQSSHCYLYDNQHRRQSH